jgi:predicted membrane-bound spermidine synthase
VPIGVFFALFTLSGFAGLIYESIWSHYLKLFLGHAAYAQTLVLAIFMGGMAIGSWLVSRFTQRIRNLLLGYAIAELGVGVLAITFHPVFVSLVDWSYLSVLPGMQSAAAINAFKWTLASVLILPASILLGTTFPLMSAGIMRLYPEEGGRPLAMLYFTNSLGASLGVLASGFVLVAQVGLPGTMLTAGIVNITLALGAWVLGKLLETGSEAPVPAVGAAVPMPWRYRALLAAVCLTGTASFIYEIAWIRLLSLGTGSSTHAFEIMLSAFILGIALGGLYARRWTATIGSRPGLLAAVFIAKGALAIVALRVYVESLDRLQWALGGIAPTEAGYALFTGISYAFSVVVMLPTAIAAGLALPLLTQSLLAKGYGEKSIGAVYSANTAGCILGAFFATHVGMEWLGTKGLTAAGAMLDVIPAVLVMWALGTRRERAYPRAAIATLVAVVLIVPIVYSSADFDLRKLASGVYRQGTFLDPSQSVLYYRDGKTATVAVTLSGTYASIRTNGKVDANVQLAPDGVFSGDEPTMVMLGSIAYAYRPDARRIANIGFGSGLTTHVALGSPRLQVMDTVEIESAMVEGARQFGARNARAYNDPRSRIIIEDAKTFFAAGARRYDVIISEPSNPWVSGVSSLFSDEFYARTRNFLEEDGLLVQWLHLYEINDDLVASMFKALSKNFGDYAVFTAGPGDLVIVAAKGERLPDMKGDLFAFPGVGADLNRFGLRSVEDLKLVRVGSKRALDPLFAYSRSPMNSDYFPVVDQHAAKARFLKQQSMELGDLGRDFVPIVRLFDGDARLTPAQLRQTSGVASPAVEHGLAAHRRLGLLLGETSDATVAPDAQAWKFAGARSALTECRRMTGAWVDVVAEALRSSAALLPHAELKRFADTVRASKCLGALPARERLRLDFYLAMGEADPAATARLGSALLVRPEPMPADEAAGVIAGTMTALLAAGRPAEALEVLRQSVARPPSGRVPMALRLALGHALRDAHPAPR